MLSEANSNANRPSRVARGYHAQFRHVLVDEYQDINAVQDAILSLVSRECLACEENRDQTQNLFCVGDVKQSIYRFRLADPDRFLDRAKRFRGIESARGSVIDLQANFRSRTPLLESINLLFGRVMRRDGATIEYDESQKLVGKLTYPCIDRCFTGSPIELHLLPAPPRGARKSRPSPADDDAS